MSEPSKDLLTRSYVNTFKRHTYSESNVNTFKRGVNVSAFERLTYSESRQYLQTTYLLGVKRQHFQTTYLLGVTSVLGGVA